MAFMNIERIALEGGGKVGQQSVTGNRNAPLHVVFCDDDLGIMVIAAASHENTDPSHRYDSWGER
jgi:hypothetical protein